MASVFDNRVIFITHDKGFRPVLLAHHQKNDKQTWPVQLATTDNLNRS